jgi:hypothetical protein
MKESYEVTLDRKGEVVKYRDDVDVYYFGLRRKKGEWNVSLPATKLGLRTLDDRREQPAIAIF